MFLFFILTMKISQVSIAGETLSEECALHLYQSTHGNFLRLHYRLHNPSCLTVKPDVAPAQGDIDSYLSYARILYLLNPAYFEVTFALKHLITITDGKISLNFTLDDCLKIFEDVIRAPEQIVS